MWIKKKTTEFGHTNTDREMPIFYKHLQMDHSLSPQGNDRCNCTNIMESLGLECQTQSSVHNAEYQNQKRKHV